MRMEKSEPSAIYPFPNMALYLAPFGRWTLGIMKHERPAAIYQPTQKKS